MNRTMRQSARPQQLRGGHAEKRDVVRKEFAAE
jgi:hypothetical protein